MSQLGHTNNEYKVIGNMFNNHSHLNEIHNQIDNDQMRQSNIDHTNMVDPRMYRQSIDGEGDVIQKSKIDKSNLNKNLKIYEYVWIPHTSFGSGKHERYEIQAKNMKDAYRIIYNNHMIHFQDMIMDYMETSYDDINNINDVLTISNDGYDYLAEYFTATMNNPRDGISLKYLKEI